MHAHRQDSMVCYSDVGHALMLHSSVFHWQSALADISMSRSTAPCQTAFCGASHAHFALQWASAARVGASLAMMQCVCRPQLMHAGMQQLMLE